jgi:hypothetical protein
MDKWIDRVFLTLIVSVIIFLWLAVLITLYVFLKTGGF